MRYDESQLEPMRAELRDIGVEELRTPEAVDAFMAERSGTAIVIINSVCGCAAGNARPGLALSLEQLADSPGRLASVFAGQDAEATARMRSYFGDLPPSSPCFSIFRDGQLVQHIPRALIESQDASGVAATLTAALAGAARG